MTDPLIDAEDDASTPLTPEARDALIPSYITQRRELNEVEQIGIADADPWGVLASSPAPARGSKLETVNRRPRLTPDRHAMLTPLARGAG